MTELKLKRVLVTENRPSQIARSVAGVFGRDLPTLETRKLLRRGKQVATGYDKVREVARGRIAVK